jgi:hydroxyacyl-ACP dehydratase HTD2-like protein with hotdog domain
MTDASLITPEALALIGTELRREHGIVTRREFQRFAVAVRDYNPLYFDDQYARECGYQGVFAPLMYVPFSTAPLPRLDALRADGTFSVLAEIPLPACPRRMAGGRSFESHRPAYDQTELDATHTLVSIAEKQGRSGRFILLTSQIDYFATQAGALLVRCTQTLIARPAS